MDSFALASQPGFRAHREEGEKQLTAMNPRTIVRIDTFPKYQMLFFPLTSWLCHLSAESTPTKAAQSWALWPRRQMVRTAVGFAFLTCFYSHSRLDESTVQKNQAPSLLTVPCLGVPAGQGLLPSSLPRALICTQKLATLGQWPCALKGCSSFSKVRGSNYDSLMNYSHWLIKKPV